MQDAEDLERGDRNRYCILFIYRKEVSIVRKGSFRSIEDLASLAGHMSTSIGYELIESAQRDLVSSLEEVGELSSEEAGELFV